MNTEPAHKDAYGKVQLAGKCMNDAILSVSLTASEADHIKELHTWLTSWLKEDYDGLTIDSDGMRDAFVGGVLGHFSYYYVLRIPLCEVRADLVHDILQHIEHTGGNHWWRKSKTPIPDSKTFKIVFLETIEEASHPK